MGEPNKWRGHADYKRGYEDFLSGIDGKIWSEPYRAGRRAAEGMKSILANHGFAEVGPGNFENRMTIRGRSDV